LTVSRLRDRLQEVPARDQRRQIAYEKADRDRLAAELKAVYPPMEAQLRDLLARPAANDREIEHINAPALPSFPCGP